MARWLTILRRLGLAWLVWRLLGPDIPPRFRGVQERPLHVTGRSVMVGHREFFVRESGPVDGPPLVLVHGWSFNGEMTFHGLIPALADRYRVIVPDHRNHGKSDRIRGRYEIADLADELGGILTALDVGVATLFGYSMGGMVAQEFAARYPGRVRHLVLAATAARPIRRNRIVSRIAFWLARGFARVSPGEASRVTLAHLSRIGAVRPEHRRWLWEALRDRDATLYYEAGNAVWRFDSRGWVRRIRVPVTVVITTDDMVVPPRAQRELADLLPNSETVELVGAGHESILLRPDDYVKIIDRVAG